MRPATIARVLRSGLEESVHLGHVAVCDADGRLVAWAGDPRRIVFARSTMKPLQAAVSLAAAREDLPDQELAVVCGSHNGEPVHVRAVRAVLARAGLGPSALRCPPGWPLDRETMARAFRPRRELHNCSGKHAGMLLACARSGYDLASYPRPGHPLQRRVLRAVRSAAALDAVVVGVDGCGVPVHGMPLASLATLYARLARPERLGALAPRVARAVAAMRARPYLVAGRGRVDTTVMETVPGVVVKGGAEGLVCAALLEPGLGVAVKVEDGGDRAAGPALLRVLAQLGWADPAADPRLAPLARRPVRGGERVVGEIASDLALRRAGNRRGRPPRNIP
ncbi:MAG TPA: asparaginase [Actinomycetota bacterium]|nr:asparaginase [Actinomycetota bacterium]